MDELARDWYNGYRSWENASPEACAIVKLWLETDRVLDPRVELFSSELAAQARFLRDRFARIRRVALLVRPRAPELFRSNWQLEPVIGSFLESPENRMDQEIADLCINMLTLTQSHG
jgi:hypothetical protein